MPMPPAVTLAAAMVIPPPLAPNSVTLIPAPVRPTTAPLTEIETPPPPVLLTLIASFCATMALPVADWVRVMPAEPGWVRLNPVPEEVTGVSEFSVTCSAVAPEAESACSDLIGNGRPHTNTPVPAPCSMQRLST